MAEPTVDSKPNADDAKSHFAKAVEEAKAGAQALGKEAQGRAGEYREKLNQTKSHWTSDAQAKGEDAKEKAYDYANQGKAKASKAMADLGKIVDDSAAVIDEKVGAKYGDYARSAAQSLQGAATKLEERSLEQLGDDAKEFIREKPALAVGLAATAGYMFARIFRRR